MRLIFENEMSTQATLNNYELFSAKLGMLALHFDALKDNLSTGTTKLTHYDALFNFFVTPHTYTTATPAQQSLMLNNIALAKAYDLQAQLHLHLCNLQLSPTLVHLNQATLPLLINFQWSIMYILVYLYVILILWQGLLQSLGFLSKFHALTTSTAQRIIYSWLFLSFDKVETTEESIVLAFLWPWCFLIVFTHLMTVTDHTALFGFSEWGLPVIYGLIMLAENCWAMGTYLFVYVAGAAGRKLSVITAIEDAVALLILIARVVLQAVRGVIVGMFHFICREMLWNMSGHWTHNTVMNAATTANDQNLTAGTPVLKLIFDCAVTGGSFVIITAVMFLQLLFLLVSVWLFCKCWFTSWRKC